jgi:hypothetical protein
LIIVDVSENERVICLKDSVSTRVLAPGRHGFWRTRNVSVARRVPLCGASRGARGWRRRRTPARLLVALQHQDCR